MAKRNELGGILAAATKNGATDREIEVYRDERVAVASDGLLLGDEVDLTHIPELTERELIEQIDADVTAIKTLEIHSFRHAVRAAACFQELEQRERGRVEAAGEKFLRTEWAKAAIRDHFEGKIGLSTMFLYERVSKPESQQKAVEFQQKIEVVSQARLNCGEDREKISNAVRKNGIEADELDYIPERFSLRSFAKWLQYKNSGPRPIRQTEGEVETSKQVSKIEKGWSRKKKKYLDDGRTKDAAQKVERVMKALEKKRQELIAAYEELEAIAAMEEV